MVDNETGPTEPNQIDFVAIDPDGAIEDVKRTVAEETPVALEFNGIGYAVLMATGEALEDLAYGFSLSERLIYRADQIVAVDVARVPAGIMLRVTLSPERATHIYDRVRHRSSESSCGLCGIENLEQAMRTLPKMPPHRAVEPSAIFAALECLRDHQPLNAITGSVHAAAACNRDGSIYLVREDVGRHNAFDKTIGAMLRSGQSWSDRFALLSSRCSYELVEKAVLAGCPTLTTISAPTSIAVKRARDAGLSLYVLARPDRLLLASSARAEV
jgi:FdhD protein